VALCWIRIAREDTLEQISGKLEPFDCKMPKTFMQRATDAVELAICRPKTKPGAESPLHYLLERDHIENLQNLRPTSKLRGVILPYVACFRAPWVDSIEILNRIWDSHQFYFLGYVNTKGRVVATSVNAYPGGHSPKMYIENEAETPSLLYRGKEAKFRYSFVILPDAGPALSRKEQFLPCVSLARSVSALARSPELQKDVDTLLYRADWQERVFQEQYPYFRRTNKQVGPQRLMLEMRFGIALMNANLAEFSPPDFSDAILRQTWVDREKAAFLNAHRHDDRFFFASIDKPKRVATQQPYRFSLDRAELLGANWSQVLPLTAPREDGGLTGLAGEAFRRRARGGAAAIRHVPEAASEFGTLQTKIGELRNELDKAEKEKKRLTEKNRALETLVQRLGTELPQARDIRDIIAFRLEFREQHPEEEMEAELELWNQPGGIEAARAAREAQRELDDAIEEATVDDDEVVEAPVGTPTDGATQAPAQRAGGRQRQ
jgi:hypothetical protein